MKKNQARRIDGRVGGDLGRDVPLNGLVAEFVEFQNTGKGFDRVWVGIGPIVEQFAGQCLAKLGVLNRYEVDPWAKDDVVSETALKLRKLGQPAAKGRFDASRAQPGISGLKGWLYAVVNSQAVNWVRDHRGGRSVKVTFESDKGQISNVLSSGDEPKAFFDRVAAKMERPDLLPLLNEVIKKLPEDLARLVRLRLDEGLSHRQTAPVVGISAPVVGRRLNEAYALLRGWLEEAGFDEAWLAA